LKQGLRPLASGTIDLQRAGGVALAVYLGIAPVYWLPGISIAHLAQVKLFLAGTGVLLVLAPALLSRRLPLPKGPFGLAGFGLLIAAASFALFQAEPQLALRRLLDIVLSFAMLWTFYSFTRAGGDVLRVFMTAALMIAAFSALTVTSWLFGLPNWTSPYGPLWFRDGDPLWLSGFGDKRTGWSNGISFFFVIVFVYGVYLLRYAQGPRRLLGVSLVGLALATILSSQLIVGGRAGVIGSAIGVLFAFYWFVARKRALLFLVVALVALGVLLSSDFVQRQLRVLGLEALGVEQLDEAATGRVEGYLVGLDLLLARPLTGYGFGKVDLNDYSLGYEHVHNFWLRNAVEGGVFLPTMLFLMVLFLIGWSWRALKGATLAGNREHGVPYREVLPFWGLLILANGLFISMLEPNVPLGAFQNVAIWWAAAGVVVALRERREVDPATDASTTN
jgi:hypothetical protein